MRTLAFVRKHINRYVAVSGGDGNQCVDLVNLYLIEVWNLKPLRLNAVDWAAAHIAGMSWVNNGPSNAPPLGAIVVWGPYAGEEISAYGHVAVALTADPMDLVTFDQNWPVHKPCLLTLHDYGGVLGWHQPAG